MSWLLIGGALVLAVGIWLRRQQARFVAGLRQAGDPLAEAPGSKRFRQRLQAWLFGMEGDGPAPARGLVTLVMVVLIGALALWSLVPGVFR